MSILEPIGSYTLNRYIRRDIGTWVFFLGVSMLVAWGAPKVGIDRLISVFYGVNAGAVGWGLFVMVGCCLMSETFVHQTRTNIPVYASKVILYSDHFELYRHDQISSYRWQDIKQYTFWIIHSGSVKTPYLRIVTLDEKETVFDQHYRHSKRLVAQLKTLIPSAILPGLIEQIQSGRTVTIDDHHFDIHGITIEDTRFQWNTLVDFKVFQKKYYLLYFQLLEVDEVDFTAISVNASNAYLVPDLIECFATNSKLQVKPTAIVASAGLR